MGCFFTILVVLGPRVGDVVWWRVNPGRWDRALGGWPITGWLWPVLGIVFVPWATMTYLVVFPGGVVGWDWLWIGLAVVSDIAGYTDAAARRRVPGYSGQYQPLAHSYGACVDTSGKPGSRAWTPRLAGWSLRARCGDWSIPPGRWG
jgi:hypothetical protein